MNKDELPSDVEQLRELVLQLASSNDQLSASNDQLVATVTKQQDKIEKQEYKITELIAALRGKQRERIDPDQLLLFEIGELEKLIEETLQDTRPKRGRKKRRARRMIPDDLPQTRRGLRTARRRTSLQGRWPSHAFDPVRNQQAT